MRGILDACSIPVFLWLYAVANLIGLESKYLALIDASHIGPLLAKMKMGR
jgi:hypothetical protein